MCGVALVAGLACSSAANAQCTTPSWFPGSSVPGIQGFNSPSTGVGGEVNSSVLWDPDGAGPLAPRLVIGGTFSFAGDQRTNNIAMWDGSAWQSLSSGMDGPVLALAATSDGHLYAGGYFFNAGGSPASNLAVWDGSSWSSVGTVDGDGVDGLVTGIVVRSNGHVIVGGWFQTAGGTVVANNIARWNGTAWSIINQGLRTGGDPLAGGVSGLTLAPDSSIIVAGVFDQAGPTAANNIARLTFNASGTTSTWTALGAGLTGGIGNVGKAAVKPNGDIVAVGSFETAGVTPAINAALWNGSTWSAMGDGLGIDGFNESGVDCKILTNGDVLVAGTFGVSGATPVRGLARWNGTAWSEVGGNTPLTSGNAYSILQTSNGDIVAGGPFSTGVARFDGTTWSTYGTGFDWSTSRAIATSTGDLIVAGPFRQTPDGPAVGVARYDGTTWSPIGSGLSFIPSCLLSLPGGNIVAAGAIAPAIEGDPYIWEVRQWDGTTWNLLSTGFRAFALIRRSNGDIIAAGNQDGVDGGVYRWDGSTWTILGGAFTTGGEFAEPTAIVALPNGDLIAGGSFDTANGQFAFNVARWNGTTWSAMGDGLGDPFNFEGIYNLAVTPAGHVIAVGSFISAFNSFVQYNGVAEWDGSAWQTIGNGFESQFVYTTAVLTDGSILVGGAIDYGLQRWNGSAWNPVDGWVEGFVADLVPLPNAGIAVAGTFAYVGSAYDANTQTFSGGTLSNSFAIFGCSTPACPSDLDNGSGTGTPDGGVDINDLLFFLTQFESGSAAADLDNGSGLGVPDGGVDINDLLFFLVHFEAGC